MNQQDDTPILSSTVTSEEDKAWTAFYQKMKEEEPTRLEEAAKFLSGTVAICLSILMGIAKLEGSKLLFSGLLTISILWLLSVIMGFLVLLPQSYQMNKDSAETIEKALKRVVQTKTRYLGISAVSFLLGLVVFVISTINMVGA
ncbi:MAG: hypothetical protein AAFY71_11090 [Bacteroidota bacterium]